MTEARLQAGFGFFTVGIGNASSIDVCRRNKT
jgi:hypothetical protein